MDECSRHLYQTRGETYEWKRETYECSEETIRWSEETFVSREQTHEFFGATIRKLFESGG